MEQRSCILPHVKCSVYFGKKSFGRKCTTAAVHILRIVMFISFGNNMLRLPTEQNHSNRDMVQKLLLGKTGAI